LRRIAWILVGALSLGNVLLAEAAPAKKGKKKAKKAKAAHKQHVSHHGGGGGPFADVPHGHWAYEAIRKSVEAGILQGWENKFHGGKVVNRYQMAVVVARMIDRLGVMKSGGRVISPQDVANLESLTIEFADELALLNVKVNKLEDAVAGLKKDVDLLKADWATVGAKAGITGLVAARAVWADDGSPGRSIGPFAGGGAANPNPSAGSAIPRYRGGPVSGAGIPGLPFVFDSRQLLTVSNFSINIDRWFDPHVHFHAQIDVNAEGSRDLPFSGPAVIAGGTAFPLPGRGESFFGAGSDIMINEAYVTWEDWFATGVNGRAGVYALPMNFEVNGPSRTYQWTVTPSIANSKWESIRPVGMDIFKLNAKDELAFYVGFFTPGDSTSAPAGVNTFNRSGTLLSSPTSIGVAAAAQTDGLLNPGGGAFGLGRFPTPFAGAAMTDAARGIAGQNLSFDDIGFYGYIGTHPTNRNHRGFTWHLAYFDRNGDIRADLDEQVSATDWYAWQGALSYQWNKFILGGQYYMGTSENYNTGDALADVRRANTTPFLNAAGEDTDSRSAMGFVNFQFSPKGSVTVRYEMAEDETGPAMLEADVFTFAFNWRTSDKGWLQAEFITADSRATSENGVVNSTDIEDDQFQLNYKCNW
jgi:hypothetical protein